MEEMGKNAKYSFKKKKNVVICFKKMLADMS